ncbi:vitamin K epoxide reductase family protein [Parasegetibacter sp. NRK P23]|uniref:vitamin K epoxide reductase family protein n=1 Tax=Parasegetibacter sp. NRK P23 TaxID=2942999 RepID=UPI0020448D1C|nr:vitamin K epoxide reductase family protein [Parasegetibacter sp. NRK P23]MCM5527874.1 hypothetical protein [Parasegetibacter sp. NRK P23]
MNLKQTGTDSVLSFLSHAGMKVDEIEFRNQVIGHPNYPSILCFSDALTFFGILHSTLRLEKKFVLELPPEFIALIQVDGDSKLCSVKRTDKIFQIENEKLSEETFKKVFEEVVLIIEEDKATTKGAGLNWSIKRISTLLIAIVSIYLLAIGSYSASAYILIVTSSIGLILAIETFRQTIGKSGIVSSLCKISITSDCSSVVKSQKWKVFEILPFSDLAIVFFTAQLILLFYSLETPITTLISYYRAFIWLSIPISTLSIYYQWKVEKKWCTLCLSIIIILYIQTYVFYSLSRSLSFYISIYQFLAFSLVNVLILFTWIEVKKHILASLNTEKKLRRKIKQSRSIKLFDYALKSNERAPVPITEKSIIYKSSKSKHRLTIVTSPFCGHCYQVHKDINKVYELVKEDLDIHIIFNNDINSRQSDIARYFHQFFHKNGFEVFHDEYLRFMSLKKSELDKKLIEITRSSKDYTSDDILIEQRDFCLEQDIFFTPTLIIDGHPFPTEFDRDDLMFFLLELCEGESTPEYAIDNEIRNTTF